MGVDHGVPPSRDSLADVTMPVYDGESGHHFNDPPTDSMWIVSSTLVIFAMQSGKYMNAILGSVQEEQYWKPHP